MSELRILVKRLNRTIGGERACLAGLVDAELVRIRSVITAAILESERMVSEAICDVHDGLPAEASSDEPGPSAGGSSDQA